MHGLIKVRRHHRQCRRRRRIRDGQCIAAKRALTAAGLYINKATPTLQEAALSCGSNRAYVRAAVVLLKSENPVLSGRALRGAQSLLAAAREAQHVAELVSAFRSATPADRTMFGKIVGADVLFDNVVVPAAA